MKFSIRKIIWVLVLVALVFAAVLALIPKPVEVETVAVAEGTLRVSVQEDGKTRIREKYIVSAPVSGRLTRISLNEGDKISLEDTLIAVILPSDPAMLDARARAQAEARVKSAEASLKRSISSAEQARIKHDLAEKKFERAERLIVSKSIAEDEFEIIRTEFLSTTQAIDSARFDTEIAKFELKMAQAAANQFENVQTGDGSDVQNEQQKVEPFEIVSPVAGKVLRVFQESSTVVSVGAPLIEVGDPRNLEIEIDVLSTDAVRIQPGAELTIDHWGGEKPLTGIVRVIEPAAFTKISSLGVEEQRVNIIADFSESADRLKSLGDGYRVEAKITVENIENTRIIPSSALFRHQREWHVFKIVNEQAVLTRVEIGSQNETHTQILNGLQQGDEVIVYPSDQVASGTTIKKAK